MITFEKIGEYACNLFGKKKTLVEEDPEPIFKIDDKQDRDKIPYAVRIGDLIVAEIIFFNGAWQFEPISFQVTGDERWRHRVFKQWELTQILPKVYKLNESKDG